MKKKVAALLLSLCMVAATMTGCGSDSKENVEKGSEQGETTSNPEVENNGENGGDISEAPKYGGTLKVATTFTVSQIGYTPELSASSALFYMCTSYESLTAYDETGAIVPLLAESWEVNTEEPSITWILKSGVKFADGTDFNAEAVKINIEEYQAANRSEVSNIKECIVQDETHIKMVLDHWDSSAVESIGFFVYYMSPMALENKEQLKTTTCGTGAFQIAAFEPNVSAKFVKNENYWQEGKPYLDGVEIDVITEAATAKAAFFAGDIDVWQGAPGITVNEILTNYAGDVESGKYAMQDCITGRGLITTGIIPNSADSNSPWADVRVRQALCYAIDSQAIIDSVSYGLAEYTDQWAMPGATEFNDQMKGFSYNPEKAKQLLADAGYPNGFTTKLNVFGPLQEMFVAVAGMLEEVGIHCEMEYVDSSAQNSYMFEGNWPGLMLHTGTLGDLGLYMSRHYGSGATFYVNGIQKYDKIDELLAKIKSAKNDEEKIALEHELQEYIYNSEDGVVVFGKVMSISKNKILKQGYVQDDKAGVYHAYMANWADAWMNK